LTSSKRRLYFWIAGTRCRTTRRIPPREDRYKVVGISDFGRVLAVSITDEDGVVRIISARKATKSERNEYESR
jgi:uncharacterized DUF497 family protein